MPIRAGGSPALSPSAPPEPRALRQPRLGFKALLMEAGEGIGHLTPGTRARLPDVVILLVMESPGSFCLCRFQHLLSKKWEALRKTAKDVFFSPGPQQLGPRLIHHCKDLSEKGKESAVLEGEKNERHMGPLSQDLLGLAPMDGCGLLHLKTAEGMPLGRCAAWLKKNCKNGTSLWLWCPSHRSGLTPPQIRILSSAPGPPGAYTTENHTPAHTWHGWGREVGAEGRNTISKQLLKSERIPVPCRRNLHLSGCLGSLLPCQGL